jgi:hypothetical protein
VVSNIQINTGKGRPRTKPREVLADAAYDDESIRSYIRRRGIRSNIPSNKRNQKKPRRGRPTRFEEGSYKKNEEPLSDFLAGSSLDSGGSPPGMRG